MLCCVLCVCVHADVCPIVHEVCTCIVSGRCIPGVASVASGQQKRKAPQQEEVVDEHVTTEHLAGGDVATHRCVCVCVYIYI